LGLDTAEKWEVDRKDQKDIIGLQKKKNETEKFQGKKKSGGMPWGRKE